MCFRAIDCHLTAFSPSPSSMDTFFSVKDFEEKALEKLPSGTKQFFRNGAINEETLRQNIEAFSKIVIIPRFLLRNVSRRDLHSTFLKYKTSVPFAVAPTALHKLAHEDGEIATAKACGRMNTVYIMSTVATTSVEDVATHAPDTIKFLQLYVYKNRAMSERLVRRAETCGFKAIVLTVDAPVIGLRLGEARSAFSLPANLKIANFECEADTIGSLQACKENGWHAMQSVTLDSSMTWDMIDWLRSITCLPILVKGILSVEDAIIAVDKKVDGIVVSNHGGRQLDTSPATIEVLPEIVDAVQGRFPVFVDGGIRTGTDILKALALGARGVLVGRPILYGLTCGGEDGVVRVLEILQKELDVALALSGCASIKDINRGLVRRREMLSRL